jgi:phosphatidylserine/phosphatidylglycerophosphate/cardiolipin synthase-like enzyme
MSFAIQSPEVFWQDLLTCAARANDVITIRVMELEAGERAKELAGVLRQKAREGVKVTLFIDWVYGRYIHGEIDLLPVLSRRKRTYNAKVRAETEQLLEEMRIAGVSISITNIPNGLQALMPICGRNHTKIYIIDEAVWIGGVHPVDSAFNNIDFMVKMESQKVVTTIKNYTAPKKDELIPIDNSTQVLFDGGNAGSSCIYSQAIALVEQAESEVIFMSQFLPDGLLLHKLIKKAKEGVAVRVITSPEKESIFTEFPANISYRMHQARLKRERNIQLIHCSHGVHAKLLIVDQKKVLFGSHNYAGIGVWLGTEEVCVISQDDLLIKDFIQYILESIPPSSRRYFTAST